MTWLNEWEVEQQAERLAIHPVLGKATRFLVAFMREVNGHSDGWAYWKAPAHAAGKLMELIQRGEATDAEVRKAMSPIKSFYTRRGNAAGMSMPVGE